MSALAARGEWAAMPGLIDDEMLDTFAVSAPLAELAAPLRERYEGLLDRVAVYRPFRAEETGWRELAEGMSG